MIQPASLSSSGCRLVTADGRTLALRKVALDVDAGHGLASVTVRQTFENRFAETLRVTYQLPLPADGAVVGFAFVIAGERVTGRIARREDARADFERAVVEGRTAALLEEDRSSVFTQEIGNLPPGATLEVEIEVEQPLAWSPSHEGWTWRFPTVIAPRYLGAPGQTPDAERITQDVAIPAPSIPCEVIVRLADAPTAAPTSPSHIVERTRDGLFLQGTLDRDVVLRWAVAPPVPTADVEVSRPAGHPTAYAQLTLVPPTQDAPQTPWARDLIVLLDTSGSMNGRPLAQLKAITTALVDSLGPADQLEIVEFSNRVRRWKRSPVLMTPHHRTQAKAFVAGLRASGGTDMHEGIRAALRPLRDEATRQVVLMSDGLIGFEGQILGHILADLPPGCRVHTVGVGHAPNRTLTEGAARAGGGHEAIVGLDDAVDEAVRDLLARTDLPLLVDVEVGGSALVDRAPLRIADLLGGSPTRIALAVKAEGGTLEVTGRTPRGTFQRTIEVAPCPAGTGRRVVATRYARERVADLEVLRTSDRSPDDVDATIEKLGLDHGIATRLTSWVAVSERATVDPRDPTRRQTVPQALPAGMSAQAVGLRDAFEVQELSLAVPMSREEPAPSAFPSQHLHGDATRVRRKSRRSRG
ncbi:MAG: VIT domain-containing protein, partial [Myxococcota bacterium]